MHICFIYCTLMFFTLYLYHRSAKQESAGEIMIRIAVVEDEEIFITQLTQYLQDYQTESGEEFDIRVYTDGDGITADYKAQYDIILMDIQMKFIDGMTAAEEIRKLDTKVIIIFITNMQQYAIRGYEVGALDYVLKPVSYFAFTQKLMRAISKIRKREKQFITFPVKGGVQRVEISDIYYVESEGHKLIYHTRKEDYISFGTIKSVEETLTDADFARGNKGYLINLEHVEGILDKCALIKGEKLVISRPRMNAFMKSLTRYWGEVK